MLRLELDVGAGRLWGSGLESGHSAMLKGISHGDVLRIGMTWSLREQTASSRWSCQLVGMDCGSTLAGLASRLGVQSCLR